MQTCLSLFFRFYSFYCDFSPEPILISFYTCLYSFTYILAFSWILLSNVHSLFWLLLKMVCYLKSWSVTDFHLYVLIFIFLLIFISFVMEGSCAQTERVDTSGLYWKWNLLTVFQDNNAWAALLPSEAPQALIHVYIETSSVLQAARKQKLHLNTRM